MTKSLLKTGKHTITAITRVNSQSKLPEGVISKTVDYNKPETLVEALRGQDVLVITLSGYTPKETEMQLINAAGDAGVAWILPNEWSPDTTNEAMVKDVFVFQPKGEISFYMHYMKFSLTTDCCACSGHSQGHRRSWQEFLRCCIYRSLVRVVFGSSCGLWDRLCQPYRHSL